MANSPDDLEGRIGAEIEAGDRAAQPLRSWLRAQREWVHRHPGLRLLYLAFVAMFGTAVVLVGLVLIPLPGPGWLIVFVGLGILGTEFHWARRLTRWTRAQLQRFWAWWRRRRETPPQSASKPGSHPPTASDSDPASDPHSASASEPRPRP